MKDYFFNFALTAIVSYMIAVLSFLIGNECGMPSTATASAAGALGGVAMSVSYTLGKLLEGIGWDKESGIRLAIMTITGIVFGIFGGWTMGL